MQKVSHNQERDKEGHGDGDDKNRPPKLLKFQSFGIDDKGQKNTEEKVGHCSKDGPNQGPAQDREETACHPACNDITKVFKTNPAKEVAWREVILIRIGKGQTDG